MRDVHVYAILAGVLFGIWPLLMNRSGVSGFASAGLFTGIAFIIVVPIAYASGQLEDINLTSPLLLFALAAGILGGLGILSFNTMLAKVSPQQVSMMFILMLMFQLAVPAIYHMIANGDYNPKKIMGVAGAFVVAYLLS